MDYVCGRCGVKFRSGLDLWRCWVCEKVICRPCVWQGGECAGSGPHEEAAEERAAAMMRDSGRLIMVHPDGTRSAVRIEDIARRAAKLERRGKRRRRS